MKVYPTVFIYYYKKMIHYLTFLVAYALDTEHLTRKMNLRANIFSFCANDLKNVLR